MRILTATLQEIKDVLDPPYELSKGFTYPPYIPKKRQTTKKTSKAVFVQKSTPLFLIGADEIEWKIELASSQEADQIIQFHENGYNLTFTGYYGETLVVDFVELRIPRVRAGRFDLEGKFRVICREIDLDVAAKCN